MKIHFVGHACIVAECADTSILMDPSRDRPVSGPRLYLRPKYLLTPEMVGYIRTPRAADCGSQFTIIEPRSDYSY